MSLSLGANLEHVSHLHNKNVSENKWGFLTSASDETEFQLWKECVCTHTAQAHTHLCTHTFMHTHTQSMNTMLLELDCSNAECSFWYVFK